MGSMGTRARNTVMMPFIHQNVFFYGCSLLHFSLSKKSGVTFRHLRLKLQCFAINITGPVPCLLPHNVMLCGHAATSLSTVKPQDDWPFLYWLCVRGAKKQKKRKISGARYILGAFVKEKEWKEASIWQKIANSCIVLCMCFRFFCASVTARSFNEIINFFVICIHWHCKMDTVRNAHKSPCDRGIYVRSEKDYLPCGCWLSNRQQLK